MNYSGNRLSTVPYEDVFIGMEVVSVISTPGKVSDKFLRNHPSGTEWLTITWANGNMTLMPHSTLTAVTVKEEELDDPGLVALFESVIEEDIKAYSRPGEIIYQVTQKEMISFAKKLIDREKKEQRESMQ